MLFRRGLQQMMTRRFSSIDNCRMDRVSQDKIDSIYTMTQGILWLQTCTWIVVITNSYKNR